MCHRIPGTFNMEIDKHAIQKCHFNSLQTSVKFGLKKNEVFTVHMPEVLPEHHNLDVMERLAR